MKEKKNIMAKKRKVGGTYKEGFYNLKKYSGKNEEAYIKRMYEMNKNLFDQAYESARKMAEKAKDKKAVVRFDEAYPNIKVWIKAKVKSAMITSTDVDITFNKGVKEATRLTFMAPVLRFKQNVIEGLKSHGLYDDFMFFINEEFNLDRLSYANGNYIYKNAKGKKVMIEVFNSPYRMGVMEMDEEVGEKVGESNG